ncbi:D-alanyl-D-alanine dipeptidase [Membranihabitans marinus]|uniref:D-alanyl-D-alanine dipeptidase n=1 Tax=Membranihabitans marinus TaxID=1227546 RepID=UPI001F00DEB1|nr:D-alanyl-D-alanine dipeptidase [Membranihabitans marinus]
MITPYYKLLMILCLPYALSAQDTLVDTMNQTEFINIQSIDSTIVLDIRYASTNNFTKKQMYDCGKCYLKTNVAYALAEIHQYLKTQGLGIKVFDCYRPQSIQYKLWDAVPNPHYVARPHKGSVHNRGGAVDLTIVDTDGQELDMGTDYDFFGEKAHQEFKDLPKNILSNRKLLKQTMEKYGFEPIRTEWWHYDFVGSDDYALSNVVWNCNN